MRPRKPRLTQPEAVSLARKVVAVIEEEYGDWDVTREWLVGKTIVLRLLAEASVVVTVTPRQLRIAPMTTRFPRDMSFSLTRSVLIDLIEKRATPSEALFNGHLRVKGTAEDLVQAHNVFADATELIAHSKRVRWLYQQFRDVRLPSIERAIRLKLSDSRKPIKADPRAQRGGGAP